MNSLRKWLYKPKKSDNSLLAQFYFADEDLNLVASELDSFDGRKDPERCTMLVNQLRVCQDKVLSIIQKIMDDSIPSQRANRDFRVKFPDDVLQDGLAGQLWFGAECLASGSSILNREVESASMRPLARALTKNLESLRNVLRDQCLRSLNEYNDRIREALIIFDKLFAEFELSYVSAMVPVKTMKEHDMLQEVTVLFSETVQRALKMELLTQDMIDDYDPALMFTIPRLAIVCGLLVYPEGPLNPDMEPTNMTEMFRPFQTLLYKIRELLYTLSTSELSLLEKALCSSEEPEVSTPPHQLAGAQTDSLLQIDQGFHESGEGIIAMDLGSGILVHSASSGSPVTPVNTHPDIGDDIDQVSPSSTVVDSDFGFASRNALNEMEKEETFSGLNKSESQDSGLQSENVSMSGTVTVDCVPISTPEVEVVSPCCSKDAEKFDVGESIGEHEEKSFKNSFSQSEIMIEEHCESNCDCDEDVCVKSCCRLEEEGGVKELCERIVKEIVVSEVMASDGAKDISYSNCDSSEANCVPTSHSCDTQATSVGSSDKKPYSYTDAGEATGEVSDNATGSQGVSRQFSWQYNIQFAMPQLSLSDAEIEGAQDRHSLGSFSSDSTLSETTPQDSVADFVVETLAQMNGEDTPCPKHIPHRTSSKPSTPRHNSLSTCTKTTKDSKACLPHGSNQTAQSTVSSSTKDSQTNTAYLSNPGADLESDSVSLLQSQTPNSRKLSKSKTKSSAETRESLRSEAINCRTGSQADGMRKCESPQIKRLKQEGSVASSASSNNCECDCDKECTCAGSETSSYNSETNDEEEIALAIQAAEMASRQEARSRFRSSSDMIHRLFVCIAGVADQLQTNYASDLRHILKCVFELNSTNLPDSPPEGEEEEEEENGEEERPVSNHTATTTVHSPGPVSPNRHRNNSSARRIFDEPPEWVPDEQVEKCTACKRPFTFVLRRHHCRNCGKIFCAKCSSTTVPLPQYGHQKPVRVCHRCFLFQVTQFTVSG